MIGHGSFPARGTYNVDVSRDQFVTEFASTSKDFCASGVSGHALFAEKSRPEEMAA
jgi:hypothetical protein